MIEAIDLRKRYVSKSGTEFRVMTTARHGQDCSVAMVVYTNVQDTKDAAAGTVWVIEESIFLRRFKEK